MKPLIFEIYKGKDGYRWRLKSSNGKILAESGEAYSRKKRLFHAVDRIIDGGAWQVIDKTVSKPKDVRIR